MLLLSVLLIILSKIAGIIKALRFQVKLKSVATKYDLACVFVLPDAPNFDRCLLSMYVCMCYVLGGSV